MKLAAPAGALLAAIQSQEPRHPSHPMEQQAGRLYSYSDDALAPTCSRSFWLLHKSKKVWFRLDERDWGQPLSPSFFYRGERIVYRGDLAALPATDRERIAASAIVWGEPVANGWGRGPKGTNYFLKLWTRWSIFQNARCHPEYFTIRYPAPLQPRKDDAGKDSSGHPPGGDR